MLMREELVMKSERDENHVKALDSIQSKFAKLGYPKARAANHPREPTNLAAGDSLGIGPHFED